MTQLILDIENNAIALPESIKGGYRAWVEDGGVELEMISRRLVRELRGAVWRVAYQYGWFDDEAKNKVIESCTRGRRAPIICAFLPPDSNEMITTAFFVVTFDFPKFMWSRTATEAGEEGASPLWADFSVELREVEPHD